MKDNLLTILNFKVDTKELTEYYNTINDNFQHFKWNFEVGGDTITDEWRQRMTAEPATLLPYGWAIQSNIPDLNEPCPPYNITTHERVEYRNTSMAFGIITKLQEIMPYAYRWSISVQPPGGKVSMHSDQEDEYTIWIPIHGDSSANITYVIDGVNYPLVLPPTGNLYLLDTTYSHYTINTGHMDRVAIIFRINQRHTIKLINIKGII